jgi:hypothetical protein
MSIEQVDNFNGPVSLVCDECGLGQDFPSFKKAVAFKKKEREKAGGWRSFKDGDVWKDACPRCVGKFAGRL